MRDASAAVGVGLSPVVTAPPWGSLASGDPRPIAAHEEGRSWHPAHGWALNFSSVYTRVAPAYEVDLDNIVKLTLDSLDGVLGLRPMGHRA